LFPQTLKPDYLNVAAFAVNVALVANQWQHTGPLREILPGDTKTTTVLRGL